MSDNNLEQWINIEFFFLRKSDSATLAILTFACDEYTMRKLSVF
jgi:hypothetical protein